MQELRVMTLSWRMFIDTYHGEDRQTHIRIGLEICVCILGHHIYILSEPLFGIPSIYTPSRLSKDKDPLPSPETT